MDKNFDKTELGSRQGQSDSHMLLYLISWGDGGTQAAARDGDMQTINHADRKIFSMLFGLYTRISTVAYGE